MQEADKFLQQYKDGSKLCETGVDEDVLPTKCDRTVINKSISDVAADPAEGLVRINCTHSTSVSVGLCCPS